MNTFVDDNSFNVYRYGTYYNPAFRQYNLTTMVNVICDRCHKNYLNVCVGWNNKNLCLECVNMIDSFVLSGIITQGIPYNTHHTTHNLMHRLRQLHRIHRYQQLHPLQHIHHIHHIHQSQPSHQVHRLCIR